MIQKMLPLWLKNKIKPFYYSLGYAMRPVNLLIEITVDCNLDCIMCPRHSIKFDKKNMSLSEFKYILLKIPGLRRISFVGFGEPFMNPEFYDMLYLLEGKEVTIVTNGALLTERNIKRLKNVTTFSISIDSPFEDKYRAIRGISLTKIKQNIQNLKKIYPNICLTVNTIIMKNNIKDLFGIIDLAQEINADIVRTIHLMASDSDIEKEHGIYYENLANELFKVNEKANKYGIKFYSPYDPNFQTIEKRECLEPWYTVKLTVNGDIYPCCYMPRSSASTWPEWFQDRLVNVPESQYKMGNIFRDSLNDLWNGTNWRMLRQIVRNTEKNIDTKMINNLGQLRTKINLNEKFSYCKICLFRWGCAC